jgi:hypothetical protein
MADSRCDPVSGERFDEDAGRFAAAEAEAVVAQADFQRVAERGHVGDFDLFPFENAHLEQALYEGVVALDRLDSAASADRQLVQGRHEGYLGGSGDGGGTNEDLQIEFQTQAQAAPIDFQQAG